MFNWFKKMFSGFSGKLHEAQEDLAAADSQKAQAKSDAATEARAADQTASDAATEQRVSDQAESDALTQERTYADEVRNAPIGDEPLVVTPIATPLDVVPPVAEKKPRKPREKKPAVKTPAKAPATKAKAPAKKSAPSKAKKK